MTKLPRKICLGIILCMLFVLTATCCIACTTVANARIDDSAIVGVAQDVYSDNENTATQNLWDATKAFLREVYSNTILP